MSRLPPSVAAQARLFRRLNEAGTEGLPPAGGDNPFGRDFHGHGFTLSTGQTLTIFPANPRRSYLLVQNNSDLSGTFANLFVHFGSKSDATKMRIRPGGFFESPDGAIPVNDIALYSDGACAVYAVEG